MLTLVEFIRSARLKSSIQHCVAVLCYEKIYRNNELMTAKEIRAALVAARVKNARKINVPDALSKSGAYVDQDGKKHGELLWKLTGTGERLIRRIIDSKEKRPEVLFDVQAIKKLIAKLKNADEKDYLNEAVICLEVGALRACVVFVWIAAIRNIQRQCFAKGCHQLNMAIKRHDPKARDVKNIDDFAYIKDRIVLLASQDLRIFDKSEREALDDCLGLRNRCGHPAKYSPQEKKVSSFIEDLIVVVFKPK